MKLNPSILFLSLLVAEVFNPPVVQAAEQEKVRLSVSYLSGNRSKIIDFPAGTFMDNRQEQRTDGFGISGRAQVLPRLDIIYRGQFLNETESRVVLPDGNSFPAFIDGSENLYQELSGSLMVPGLKGHRVIVGAMIFETRAWDEDITVFLFDQEGLVGEGLIDDRFRTRFLGLVVGGEGQRSFGDFELNYSGRYFPRVSRKDIFDSVLRVTKPARPDSPRSIEWRSRDHSSSSGFELTAGVTYWFSSHIGLRGAYLFRQFHSEPFSEFFKEKDRNGKQLEVGVEVRFL